MIVITQEQIIIMHRNLVTHTGGKSGVKDYHSLDFCVKSPFATFDGKDLYPTILEKLAMLSFNLITKHPFHDGNKRIGVHILLLSLKLNNIGIFLTVQEVIKLGLGIASNEISQKDLINFLQKKMI